MIIALTGYMGSGKTSLGSKLASMLNFGFIDLDEEIQRKTGFSPAQIIRKKGISHFRELENFHLQKIFTDNSGKIILSLGGGTVLKRENLNLLKEKTLLIFIDTPFEIIMKRLARNHSARPVLPLTTQGDIDTQSAFAQYLLRLPYYTQAHLRFKNTYENPEISVVKLFELVKNHLNS